MRAVVQRVSSASVKVDNALISEINQGFLVLIGVEVGDTEIDSQYIINKITGLRIFNDNEDKMNLSIIDIKGEIIAISQFTLSGDARHGRRPSFIKAEEPSKAIVLYNKVCEGLEKNNIPVKKGVFGADMKVSLVNDGPVTILLDSKKLF